MIQTTTHENHFVISALRRHLINAGGRKEETTAKKEQALYKILSKAKGQDLLSISIRQRLASGKLGSLKEVIEMLKQQYKDCGRERMIEVFGSQAVSILETIS